MSTESSSKYSKLILPAVLALLVALLSIMWFVRSADYTAKNERIFAQLPRYPGSDTPVLDSYESSRSLMDFGARSVTLEATYRLEDAPNARDVAAFFAARMPDEWRPPSEACRGFRRGSAVVVFALDSFEPTVLRVAVDARGSERCSEIWSTVVS